MSKLRDMHKALFLALIVEFASGEPTNVVYAWELANTHAIGGPGARVIASVHSIETSNHAFSVSSKEVVAHNVSEVVRDSRVLRAMNEVKADARELLPNDVAPVYEKYLDAWSKQPQGSAVDISAATDATELRGSVEAMRDFLASVQIKLRGKNLITRIMNRNNDRKKLVDSVIDEAERLANSENFTLLDYQRLADGYLYALKEQQHSSGQVGQLWENNFQRLRRAAPEIPTTSDLGTSDWNRGNAFGIGYVRMLDPSRIVFDHSTLSNAFELGAYDVNNNKIMGEGSSAQANFGEYLLTTSNQLRFYDSFERSTDRAIGDAWWFYLTHHLRRSPTPDGLLHSDRVKSNARGVDERQVDAEIVEKFVDYAHHPLGFGPPAEPLEIYEALGRVSTFVKEQGGAVPVSVRPETLQSRERPPFKNDDFRKLYIVEDVALPPNFGDGNPINFEEGRIHAPSQFNVDDQTPMWLFSSRPDGLDLNEGWVVDGRTGAKRGIGTTYIFETTAEELQKASESLYQVKGGDGDNRIVSMHGFWRRAPGIRSEVIGWGLPTKREPNYQPILPGKKLWDGSPFSGPWVDRKGVMHPR